MLPCATLFDLEKQFQAIYTHDKFREFQVEITSMLYCRVLSTAIEVGYLNYEVVEKISLDGYTKKVKYYVKYREEGCGIECSCHLFEFKGIVCRHALLVLKNNDVGALPDKYVLRRWRRDISRHYTKLKINYSGWITTDEQVRYDRLSHAFGKLADVASGDEQRTQKLIEWIELQMNELNISSHQPNTAKMTYDCPLSLKDSNETILDPKFSKTKGAPRKLRKKGPLETSCQKTKVGKKANKSKQSIQIDTGIEQILIQSTQEIPMPMVTPLSYSQQLMGAHYHTWNSASGNFMLGSYGINEMVPMFPATRLEDDVEGHNV
ncbi:hypothetical protein OROHE_024327 [Orobanche hederae]